MDPEVTRTLGELERKILELERTLDAVSRGIGSPISDGGGRIVDEKIERRPTSPLAPAPPPPAPTPPRPASAPP